MSALAGRRVVVTRSIERAVTLVDALLTECAVPIVFPTIETAPPESFEAMDAALRTLADYDWVVFTSASGVHATFERMRALDGPGGWLEGTPVAAVGPATAAALSEHGVGGVAMPPTFEAGHMPAAMGEIGGRRFLLLRADLARATLPDQLRALGASVDDVIAYRTVPLSERWTGGPADAVREGVDAVTFTSPSTVAGFVNGIGSEWRDVVNAALVVTIGPATSEAARAAGMRVAVEADPHTVGGLVAALASAFTAVSR